MYGYVKSHAKETFDRIHYRPAISEAQLLPVLSHAIAVVMPSRIDNYPNACLEAQAMGIPVIGSFDSSLEEMIIDHETGFLIRNGNLRNLVTAMNSVLQLSSAERDQMRARIKDGIRQIEAEDRVGQLIEFYQKAIQEYEPAVS